MQAFKGVFFLPDNIDNSDKYVVGDLHITETGITLDLFGALFEENMAMHPMNLTPNLSTTIWGFLASGKKMSLLDCRFKSHTIHFGGIQKEIYRSKYVLEDIHIDDAEAKEFNSICISVDKMHEWVGLTGKSLGIYENNNVDLKYERPDTISYNISEDIVYSFVFSHNISFPITEFKLNEYLHFEIKTKHEQNIEWFIKEVEKVRKLFSLLIFSPLKITELSLKSSKVKYNIEDKDIAMPLTLYHAEYSSKNKNEVSIDVVPTRYVAIKQNLVGVFQTWNTNMDADSFSNIIQILYDLLDDTTKFNPINFVSCFMAVEGMHRIYRIENKKITKEAAKRIDKDKKIFTAILDSCSLENHKEWLEKRLKYNFDYRAQERLTELLRENFHLLFWGNDRNKINAIATKIVEARNGMTHIESNRNNNTGTYLYYLLLKNLLLIVILKHIGIDETQLNERFLQENKLTPK